jgi:hypothetical protein
VARSSHNRQRRSRGILLGAIALFLAAQVVGGLLIDYRWTQFRFPYAHNRFHALESEGRSPNLIYLGSSRIQMHLNAPTLTEAMRRLTGRDDFLAFDGAIPASDPVTMEYAFAEYLKRGARPEWVIVEICPESINHHDEWFAQHVIRQWRWEDIAHYFVDICRTNNLGRLALARFVPLYLHRHQFVKMVREHVAAWEAPPPQPDQVRQSAKTVTAQLVSRQRTPALTPPPASKPIDPRLVEKFHAGAEHVSRYLRHYEIGGARIESLERLLANCQAHGCKILLLGAPVTSPHRAIYTPAIDAQYRNYVKHLQEKFGCEFFEGRERIPDHWFIDNHHASLSGAMYFSQIVAEEALTIGAASVEERSAP